MAGINLHSANIADESFLHFIANHTRHAAVLHMILGALPKYHQAIRVALRNQDNGGQQDLALITRYLKSEAAARVDIRVQCTLLNCFERHHGDTATTTLLEHQNKVMSDLRSELFKPGLGHTAMEAALSEVGVQRQQSGWAQGSRTNLRALVGLRAMRHEVFQLTREMHKVYYSGERERSWGIKMKVDAAQGHLSRYAQLASGSGLVKIIRELYGEDESQRIAGIMRTQTRIPEYEALRNQIRSTNFYGRIHGRLSLMGGYLVD